MADEAEGVQVAEEVKIQAEGYEGPQDVEVSGGEEGNRSPITVDSVVDSLLKTEEGPEKDSIENAKHSSVSCQDQKDIEEWSSDDEHKESDQVSGIDNDMTSDELRAQLVDGGDGSQAVLDCGREFTGDQQEAVREAEPGPEEAGRGDDNENVFNIEPTQSRKIIDQKKDTYKHTAESQDSADENSADGVGSLVTQDSSPKRVASPLAATSRSPADCSQNSVQIEEMECVDDKANDQHVTEELHLETSSEQCHEPHANNEGDLLDPKSDSEDVHVVAQDLIQQVLDNVIMAGINTSEEHVGTKQATETKLMFSGPDKVDMNDDTWASEDLPRTSPALDNASLSNGDVDMDRKNDTEKLPSDLQPLPEFDEDLKHEGIGSGVDLKPCEGGGELQEESRQFYQYTSDCSQSAASSPCSQDERSLHQGILIRPEPDLQHKLSPKTEYLRNTDNYKVCRMLCPGIKECLILETGEQVVYDCSSHDMPRMLCPGIKECLILETGEQVVYDCSSHDMPISTHHPATWPDCGIPRHMEKVKRSLYGVPDSGDTFTVHNTDAASTTEFASQPGHSLLPASSRSAQDQLSVRSQPEKQEAEESHDGSYLWLQRQVLWRAGSSGMPAVKSVKENVKGDRHITSPSSRHQGSREEVRGDSRGGQSTIGDGRLEMSTSVSASTDVSGSMTSPGAIPNFNTLRDQQVSWLSMYRMLEEQHRTQLQAQYTEHQRMINDMQRQLEGELLSQQQSMRQKLESHREALRETSSYSGNNRTQGSRGWYNKHSVQGDGGDLLPWSDELSPLQEKETYTPDASRQFQSGSSQPSYRDNTNSLEISGEKRLRGGVYSSPMPTAKFRTSTRERSSYEPVHQESCTGTMRSERRSQVQEEDYDSDSRQLSTQALSPRSHQSLHEKHAKHLSDLRSYYEAEIQDLRQKLSAEGLHHLSSSVSVGRESAREHILQKENQMLRLQLRDLQDSLDDSHIYSRDLEQKLQGLEIRASDYAKRYEESQNNVLQLKNRLEELHSYAKDRESVLEQVQTQERRQAAELQKLYKAKEEEEERARRDGATMKRLLDKYELLEKDHSALKDTSAEFEQKLFDARSEAVHLNKMISQLELEHKRLTHDYDNMRRRLAISGSLAIPSRELAETGQFRASCEHLNGYNAGSLAVTHSHTARSGDTTPPERVLSDDEDAAMGTTDSPLLRAERELRRLQQTLDHGEFIPRLQPKKYTAAGSLCPASGEVTIIDAFSLPRRSGSGMSVDVGTKEGLQRGKKTVSSQPAKREKPSSAHSKQRAAGKSPQKSSQNADSGPAAGVSSPTRFDVGVSQTAIRSAVSASTVGKRGRNREGAQTAVPSVSKTSSGDTQLVDRTLERIRSGQFVSRPQWEDVYTSLAKPAQSDKPSSRNMTQEEVLRDRLRSIDQIEKRYDDLQVEKRQLESQLNKVPAHGRDRKSRREKELLEEKLDSVDHELGSLRMTLKRYQVLKSTM